MPSDKVNLYIRMKRRWFFSPLFYLTFLYLAFMDAMEPLTPAGDARHAARVKSTVEWLSRVAYRAEFTEMPTDEEMIHGAA